MRIYLKQPSPQWLDYTMRTLTFYTKRTDYNSSAPSLLASPSNKSQTTTASSTSAFDSFKGKLAMNMNGLKKSTKHQVDDGNNGMSSQNQSKILGSAVHAYDDNCRRIELA